jgi:chromate transport protein ChrA
MKITSILGQWFFGVIGAAVAYLKPTLPIVLICTLAILYDCYTAFKLSKRVSKNYPGANDGKFKSDYAKRIFNTMLKIYALIMLTYLIDTVIIPFWDLHLHNIIAGVFCFAQIWSILENESSENDSSWARILQKVMVNKAERHFDIDLNDLKQIKKHENENTD